MNDANGVDTVDSFLFFLLLWAAWSFWPLRTTHDTKRLKGEYWLWRIEPITGRVISINTETNTHGRIVTGCDGNGNPTYRTSMVVTDTHNFVYLQLAASWSGWPRTRTRTRHGHRRS